MAIHAVIRDKEGRPFFDLGPVALEGIGELAEAAAQRETGLDVFWMLYEGWLRARCGLRCRLRLLGRAPNDGGLTRLGGVTARHAAGRRHQRKGRYDPNP